MSEEMIIGLVAGILFYVVCGFGIAARLRRDEGGGKLWGLWLLFAFLFWPIFALFMEW